MKRYKHNGNITRRYDRLGDTRIDEVKTIMEEDYRGDWVKFDDVEKIIKYLEDQIPEKRIERLEKRLGLVSDGKCPECESKTRGWVSPSGLLAPEMWATLKEQGINPASGHKKGCSLDH